jgi:GT2 family glycosyltransferase
MEGSSNKIVSVIIVTRGISGYSAACLNSLRTQTFPHFETIVIDNSLTLAFGQRILNDYPFVKLYPSCENLFYCRALNKGIEVSRGSFILCLNDDVILDKYFIERALEGFSYDPRIGAVSGKILRQDGVTLDSTGLFLTLWRTAGERGYGARDKGQFQKKEYIFGVTGAAAFYRRKMLDEIKENGDYFDPDFHIFYEDLDIAWRARRFGWKGYYCPEAITYHLRGGTVRLSRGINKPYARKYLDDRLHADLVKNRYLTIVKNESMLGLLFHSPYIFMYDLLAWSYILLFRPQQIKIFILNLKYVKSALIRRKCRNNSIFSSIN